MTLLMKRWSLYGRRRRMSRYIQPLYEVYDPDKSFLENKIAVINNLQNYTEYCEEELKNIWKI